MNLTACSGSEKEIKITHDDRCCSAVKLKISKGDLMINKCL
jgi:hypothetical protein